MGNRFTRNIEGIKNVFKQGLETNNQNDLLSQTDGNVFVRTMKHYHNLTDNVKNINGDIVTMNGGNKLVLPIIVSMNHYEYDKKHFIIVNVAGDVTEDYGLTKGSYSEWVKGEYDSDNNVTTFVVEVVANSNYYKQVRMGLILPPENEGDGEGFKPLYTLDTLYMNATDYNVTDKLSPKYLLGRELIATKKELADVKALLPKSIVKNVHLFPLVDMGSVMVNFDSYSIQNLKDVQVKLLHRTPDNEQTELSKTKIDLAEGYDYFNLDMSNHLIPDENKNDMWHLYVVEVKHGTDYLVQTTIELRNANHQMPS